MASAQGDEQGKADAEDGEWDEEVGVGEDGSGLVGELHGYPAGERGMDWGNHKDARGGVSRMRVETVGLTLRPSDPVRTEGGTTIVTDRHGLRPDADSKTYVLQ